MVGGGLLYRHFFKAAPPSTVEFNFSGNVTQVTPPPVKLVINGRTIIRDSLIHDTIKQMAKIEEIKEIITLAKQ